MVEDSIEKSDVVKYIDRCWSTRVLKMLGSRGRRALCAVSGIGEHQRVLCGGNNFAIPQHALDPGQPVARKKGAVAGGRPDTCSRALRAALAAACVRRV